MYYTTTFTGISTADEDGRVWSLKVKEMFLKVLEKYIIRIEFWTIKMQTLWQLTSNVHAIIDTNKIILNIEIDPSFKLFPLT